MSNTLNSTIDTFSLLDVLHSIKNDLIQSGIGFQSSTPLYDAQSPYFQDILDGIVDRHIAPLKSYGDIENSGGVNVFDLAGNAILFHASDHADRITRQPSIDDHLFVPIREFLEWRYGTIDYPSSYKMEQTSV